MQRTYPFQCLLSLCCLCFLAQDSKNGSPEEEEKQAENGKKEEERGKEQEGERDGDKTDSEMGTEQLERQKSEALSSKDERLNYLSPPHRRCREGEGW